MSQIEATYKLRAQLGGWWQLSEWERQIKKQWPRDYAQGLNPTAPSQAARAKVLVKRRSSSLLTLLEHEHAKLEGAGNAPRLAHAR